MDKVVEAVMMAKAGLVDDDKPMASLLFVGPTGVGKTEVVRVLAKELGIELVRFDMSEYTEKHTVAKGTFRQTSNQPYLPVRIYQSQVRHVVPRLDYRASHRICQTSACAKPEADGCRHLRKIRFFVAKPFYKNV